MSTSPAANPRSAGTTSGPRWLRYGYTFYLYLQLESGQLTWSSVAPWRVFASRFSEFLTSRGIDHPALAADPAGLRPPVLDFQAFLRQWRRGTTGPKERGGPLDDRSVGCTQRVIGNFYRTMRDYKADVAAATGDDRCLELTDSHARLYRVEECRTASSRSRSRMPRCILPPLIADKHGGPNTSEPA